jgi:hypothetical protein
MVTVSALAFGNLGVQKDRRQANGHSLEFALAATLAAHFPAAAVRADQPLRLHFQIDPQTVALQIGAGHLISFHTKNIRQNTFTHALSVYLKTPSRRKLTG